MALTDKLDAIGNAIREKTGDTEKYTLDEMPQKIEGILEGPTDSELVFNVSRLDYWDYFGMWDWFIRKYGNKIKTKNVFNYSSAFSYSNLIEIPFDLNCYYVSSTSSTDISNIFKNASKLKKLPYLYNCAPTELNSVFYQMTSLLQIQDDYFDTWHWQTLSKNKYANNSQIFYGASCLFTLPPWEKWVIYFSPESPYYNHLFYSGFCSCNCLQELVEIPLIDNIPWTRNYFYDTFQYCYSMKRLTFQTNIKPWKAQVIDLSEKVGYGSEYNISSLISNYSPLYLTKEQIVNDDASYQRLKNEKYWIASNIAYSRYNHDSAVETINSLPDTSAYLATAGGTNTIKFRGAAGEKTDGGAINTLTDSEIAVATAKGWTVTFV